MATMAELLARARAAVALRKQQEQSLEQSNTQHEQQRLSVDASKILLDSSKDSEQHSVTFKRWLTDWQEVEV